jgi:hypothetical protein
MLRSGVFVEVDATALIYCTEGSSLCPFRLGPCCRQSSQRDDLAEEPGPRQSDHQFNSPKKAPRVEGVRARVTVGNSRVASSVQSIGHCIKRTFVSAHREENGGPKCFESCLSSVQWRLLCCFQKGHSPVTVMAVTMVVTTAVTMVVTTAVTMVVATAVTIAVTGITAAGITAAGITAVGTVRVGVGAMVRVGVGAMADVCGLAG